MAKNHLIHETSPYLIQHLDNPVDWYPWSKVAFDQAQLEDKPIFLSIGYSTCHWCHVMAHESFENPQIAKVLNDSFISIKVDREQRPDIDHIYMSVTSMMTGQGGWPLSVFLTPQGKPFYAGTYFPAYAKWGSPGFMDVLNSVTSAWRTQKEDILSSAQEITITLSKQVKSMEPFDEVLDSRILDRAFEQIAQQFDSVNGGFSSSPKFPMAHQLSFLLRYYKRKNNAQALFMVEKTVKAILAGGIYDQLAGGVHRYSTDTYWHTPHFEKMLYDQSLFTKALLELYQITSKVEYVIAIRKTLDYVLENLTHSQGGFYSAEDADSAVAGSKHKMEGAFYVWSYDEINQALLGIQAEVFMYIYGVFPDGNVKNDPHGEFIGKNILYVKHSFEEAANHFNMQISHIEEMISGAFKILLSLRVLRPKPLLDDKVLTDWNGLMMGVFAQAGAILNEPKYLLAAKKSADFVLSRLNANQKLLHCWCKDESSILAMLDDYAFLVNGLLDIYESSAASKYFDRAQELADRMIEFFQDHDKGGFYLTSKEAEDLIIRPKEYYDGAIPSGNSAAVYALIRLYQLTSQTKWKNSLEKALKNFSPLIERMPSAYTYALGALDFYLGPSIHVIIEGKIEAKFEQMKKVVYKYYIPNKTILFNQNEGLLKASVCYGNTCQAPTSDINEFEMMVLKN